MCELPFVGISVHGKDLLQSLRGYFRLERTQERCAEGLKGWYRYSLFKAVWSMQKSDRYAPNLVLMKNEEEPAKTTYKISNGTFFHFRALD